MFRKRGFMITGYVYSFGEVVNETFTDVNAAHNSREI